MRLDSEALSAQLEWTLVASDLPGLGLPDARGSRDVYDFEDFVLLVLTDRLDDAAGVRGSVPFKGEVTTKVASWWFGTTDDLAPSPIERVIDAQAVLLRRTKPLGFLIGAWSRLSGSLWRAYRDGSRRVDDLELADGLAMGDPLERPLITAIDAQGAPVQGVEGLPRYVEASALAGQLFGRGRELSSERGVELVESVYELAEHDTGELGALNLLHAPHLSTYVRAGHSLNEADIVESWCARGDYDAGSGDALPCNLRLELARAYLDLGERFVADFAPTPGRAINRLSFSLSTAGILA